MAGSSLRHFLAEQQLKLASIACAMRLAIEQAGWRAGGRAGRQAGGRVGRQAGGQAGRQVGGRAGKQGRCITAEDYLSEVLVAPPPPRACHAALHLHGCKE